MVCEKYARVHSKISLASEFSRLEPSGLLFVEPDGTDNELEQNCAKKHFNFWVKKSVKKISIENILESCDKFARYLHRILNSNENYICWIKIYGIVEK